MSATPVNTSFYWELADDETHGKDPERRKAPIAISKYFLDQWNDLSIEVTICVARFINTSQLMFSSETHGRN